MSLVDARGLQLTGSSASALREYERASELTLNFLVDPVAAVTQAVTEDPDLAMAHALRAGLAIMSSERGAQPLLADALANLERLGSRLNERERGHAAAARAWMDGDFELSLRRYHQVSLDNPRDLLALQVGHIGDFFLGRSQMLRDRVAQVLPHWDASVPGYGFVLGMYAFGLEQTMAFSRAEDAGRRALELNRRDSWAVHAVAHVMETQGRVQEGIDWLEGRQGDWVPDSGFAYHNWWHLALFHLELGDHARVLDIYDKLIRPKTTNVAYENVDAAALLWRLSLRGVDVGDRWQSVADGWEPLCEEAYYAFNDVHAVMAFIGAHRSEALARTLAAMERRLSQLDAGTNWMMTRDVGLPLARALVAFDRGDHAEAIARLMAVRPIAHRFGGSHAQRDIIHLTLVESALRSGQGRLARALCAERTELKPQSPFNWLLTARSLETLGDQPGAVRAMNDSQLRRKVQLGRARALAA